MNELPPHHLVKRIHQTKLHQTIADIGREIAYDFRGQEVTFLTILLGGLPFNKMVSRVAGNAKARPKKILQATMQVGSYDNETVSNGHPRILQEIRDPDETIYKRDVVIQDDVADTKLTFARTVLPYVLSFNPNSVSIATMLTKKGNFHPEANDVNIDYSGFDIDYFAVGTGLDYAQLYRDLAGIWEVVFEK